MTFLPADPARADDPSRVAFAVPRRTGTAVVRNRLRRRCRAHLLERSRGAGSLAAGAYLVALGPGSADLDGATLRASLDRCLDRLAAGVRR